MLEDTLINEGYEEETFKQLRVSFLFTSIEYDHINNSFEVCIEPAKLKKRNNRRVYKKIREIIGNEIDLTISSNGLARLTPLRIEKSKAWISH